MTILNTNNTTAAVVPTTGTGAPVLDLLTGILVMAHGFRFAR